MNRDYDMLRIVNEVPHLRMASAHHPHVSIDINTPNLKVRKRFSPKKFLNQRRCTLNTSPNKNSELLDSQVLQQQPSEQPLEKASAVGPSTWFKAPMQKPNAFKLENLGARLENSIGGWFS